jgi:hypothetical protein
MAATTTPATPILPDWTDLVITIARCRGDLENLLASPSTPPVLTAELQVALGAIKRLQGSAYVAWSAAPDEPEDGAPAPADPTPPLVVYREADAWEPDFNPDDPYADDGVPFELTEQGLRAAVGVA